MPLYQNLEIGCFLTLLLYLYLQLLYFRYLTLVLTENNDKETQRYNESSSQVKRRRVLQFESEASDAPLCNEELSSSFLNSQVGSHVVLKLSHPLG